MYLIAPSFFAIFLLRSFLTGNSFYLASFSNIIVSSLKSVYILTIKKGMPG